MTFFQYFFPVFWFQKLQNSKKQVFISLSLILNPKCFYFYKIINESRTKINIFFIHYIVFANFRKFCPSLELFVRLGVQRETIKDLHSSFKQFDAILNGLCWVLKFKYLEPISLQLILITTSGSIHQLISIFLLLRPYAKGCVGF